jgi:hypothetical protein
LVQSVSNTRRNWDDGGKFFTNYVAHPQGGAVYAHIYRQNDRMRHAAKMAWVDLVITPVLGTA